MNVANFANLFHQNNIFQQHKPLGQKPIQPPINDTLNRLSENLLTAQKRAKDMKARFDTLELSAEATESQKNSALADVPEELLRFYLNQCKVGATISQHQETALMEYRDQLSAFDQTIQEYQDMLDSKTALPEQMKQEDVALLLEITKAAREQFLQQGAEKLNQFSKEAPTPKGLLGNGYSMIVGETGNAQEEPRWQIDASAGDLYGQIDRALASAHKVTSTFQDGASSILAELKRRGCVQAGEDFSLGDQEATDSGADVRASLFQDIRLDAIILENEPATLKAIETLPKKELVVDPYGEIDPDRTIARRAYMDSLVEQVNQLKQTIRDYYSEAHAENSSMPLLDALRHIGNKYLDRYSNSPEFRADMSYDERQMAYYQERSLLTGRHLKLNDPYALASIGGSVSFFKMQEIAEQAAKDKLNALLAEHQ